VSLHDLCHGDFDGTLGKCLFIQIEDRGNQRILHTWNTVVELSACPGCGRFYAPRPMAFLEEMHPEVAELWTLCPECRRMQTSRQWLDSRR